MDKKRKSRSKNNKGGFMFYFMKTFIIIAFTGLFLINAPSASFAKGKDDKGKSDKKVSGVKKTDVKAYEGTINSVSRRYITIEIRRDLERKGRTEIVIPYDEQTVLTGVSGGKEIIDLEVGSRVKINYTEVYFEDEDQKRNGFKRLATQVSLTRGAR